MSRSSTNAFVTKIPRDYAAKVLRRLLPPPEAIASMNKAELIELAKKTAELRKLIAADPVRFFQPNLGGQAGFMEWEHDEIALRLYIAGNKSGKSTAGGIAFGERLLGRPLWGLDHRKFTFPTPAKGACFTEDFDSHRETTIPTMRSWWPKGTIKREWHNSQGYVTEMELANGSVITFRTYDQGADKAEGKDWDVVLCDEPPPRDVYVAMRRGLVVSNGLCLIAATLVKEAWLFDEQEAGAFVKVFEGTIHDNQWISAQGREAFLSTLDDDERQVREHGKPSNLVGVIYKGFQDSEIIDGKQVDSRFMLPEDYEVDSDWPIILGVDPHERRPCYLFYGVVTPEDDIHWLDWMLGGGNGIAPSEMFETMAEFEREALPARPRLVVMDPNRGPAIQIGGVCWEDTFNEAGYEVFLGNDDIRFGHSAVREYFKYDPDDPKSFPRMRFHPKCRGRGGPIHQLKRYSWEDFKNKLERSAKETPRQINKDFPDIIRYVAAARLTHEQLFRGTPVIDRRASDWRRWHNVA